MEKSEEFSSQAEELRRLKLENKKLARANKRLQKDCEFLTGLKEQIARNQDFIQRENAKQIFYNSQLLDTYPYPLILTDEKLVTVMASRHYYEHCVYDKDDIIAGVPLDKALEGLLSKDHIRQLIFKCNNALHNKKDRSLLLEFMYDGELRSFQVNINCMLQAGEISGLNIMFMDMTEVVAAMEKAEAADRAKSNFLANMSHEIRTPMNVISGMAEFILRDSKDDEAKRNAAMIKSASKSLLSIINDILDFSKIESGRLEIIDSSYQFASMINDVVSMIRIRLQDKNVELNLELNNNIPNNLYGDEVRVKQILINLLNNAVKFTNEGSITLYADYKQIDDENCRLSFNVKDTGIGIKKEDLTKIFNSFTQVDTKRNRSVEGTGLGLAISKRLVDMMNGSLNVESVYGEGSVFSFDIISRVDDWEPMGDLGESIRKVKPQSFRITFSAPDVRVLVVDDNAMNLRVAEGMLKPYGIYADCVLNGPDAIESFSKSRYDIILMDHMMPVMDGVEAMKKIRDMEGGKDVIIFALTANAISGVRARYVREGFDDFIAKPIDIGDLDELLKKYIPEDKIKPVSIYYDDSDDESEEYEETDTEDDSIIDDDIPEADEDIIERLENIRFINIDTGLKYCMNNEDFYVMMLEEYLHNSKLHKLQEDFDGKDWEDYRITIHSVKSTSLNIGAEKLSESAKALEMALNDNDTAYVEKHHADTLKEYEMLLKEISNLFGGE